jgi:hypothetical protein
VFLERHPLLVQHYSGPPRVRTPLGVVEPRLHRSISRIVRLHTLPFGHRICDLVANYDHPSLLSASATDPSLEIEGPPDRQPHQHAGAQYAEHVAGQNNAYHSHRESHERPTARPPLLSRGHGDTPLPKQHTPQRAPADQCESSVEQV